MPWQEVQIHPVFLARKMDAIRTKTFKKYIINAILARFQNVVKLLLFGYEINKLLVVPLWIGVIAYHSL